MWTGIYRASHTHQRPGGVHAYLGSVPAQDYPCMALRWAVRRDLKLSQGYPYVTLLLRLHALSCVQHVNLGLASTNLAPSWCT